MGGNSLPQISRADEDCFILVAKAEDSSNLFAELIDNISISLLPEAAEAVEILANLRGCQAKLCGELRRGNPSDALFRAGGSENDGSAEGGV